MSVFIGGNAVDAAVAAAMCLGVVSPGSSGMGGGSFILFYNETSQKATFVDGRETAPSGAHKDMFVEDPSLSYGGGLAIAVPGQVPALYEMWEKHGKIDWYDIVIPAAKLARRFQVSSTLAGHVKNIESQLLHDNRYSHLKNYLSGRYNRLVRAGDYLENTVLEETLVHIATHKPEYFYVGHTGKMLSDEIIAAGGIITTDDLSGYTAKIREPVASEALGFMYYGAPPPSSGGLTLATILNYLGGFRMPMVAQGDVYYHRLIESFKHAFALRMSLGDPDFVNVSAVSAAMLSKEYADALRKGDNDFHVDPDLESYGGEAATGNKQGRRLVEDHGTSHLRFVNYFVFLKQDLMIVRLNSVVDKWGNSVSLTSTINTYFGSKIYSRSTGIILNNQMDDFSSPNTTNVYNLAPFETNFIEPGKRPLSSMSPFVMADGETGAARLVGGASGGPKIITTSAQVLLNVIGRGMSLLQAFLEPRLHSQLYPDEVTYESISGLEAWGSSGNGLIGPVLKGGDGGSTDGNKGDSSDGYVITAESSTIDALTSRGHTVRATGIAGVAQFISVDPDTREMLGVSDPRKNGKAYGVTDDIDENIDLGDEGGGQILLQNTVASMGLRVENNDD